MQFCRCAGVFTFVQTHDHAVAVFRLLDGFQNDVFCVRTRERVRFACCAACGGAHRLIQEVRLRYGRRAALCFGVRVECVGEYVHLLIGDRIRLCAGFDERQRHFAVVHGVTVFAVV